MIKDLLKPKSPCPCGSGKSYDKCCKPFHAGNAAPTAENLMRARYSAYCMLNSEYLNHTWHPGSRPKKVNLSDDSGVQWLKLEIIRKEQGSANDKMGVIEFKAYYTIDDKPGYLHETSNFVKEDNQWFYFDGETEYHNDEDQDDFKDFKPVRRLSVET